MLEIFYAEAKSKDGTSYSKSTLVGIRAAINRHLRNPPFKRNIVIMTSAKFATSNRMLFAVIKNPKQKGLDYTKHYSPISNADLEHILEEKSFNQESPKQLQEKVFFDIMMNFARRGRENLRSLRPSSFEFAIDDSGSQYCELNYNEHTKNHQSIEDQQSKPRMYENNKITCPLRSLKLYISKLHPDCEFLFVKPKVSKFFFTEKENIWYTSKPLGIQALGNLMKTISKRLNLSKTYTNHCIRSTCITLLASHGLEARQIMRVSGHKSESSLRSYDHDNSVEQKRKISAILSKNRQASSTFACSRPRSTNTLSEATSMPISSSSAPASSTRSSPLLHLWETCQCQ